MPLKMFRDSAGRVSAIIQISSIKDTQITEALRVENGPRAANGTVTFALGFQMFTIT